MKKFFKKLVPFVLCLCMLFMFACGNDTTPDNGDNNPPDNTGTQTPGDGEQNPPDETDDGTVFKITAKTTTEQAVADAYFEIFYYGDPATWGDKTIVSSGKTDASGIAAIKYEPTAGVTYMAQIAEHGAKVIDPAIDYRYELNDDESSLTFDAERKATAVFDYYPNKFPGGTLITRHPYKREYNAGGDPTVTDTSLTLDAKANVNEYFFFSPYVKPDFDEVDDPDAANENANVAASGVYSVAYSVQPSDANVTMYRYYGSVTGYVTLGEDKAPASVQATTAPAPADPDPDTTYCTGNAITVELYKADAQGGGIFGVVADKACTVTVTITRTDDVIEEADYPTQKVPVTATEKWTNAKIVKEETDDFVGIDYKGNATVVLGSDGYYHVDTENGPVLYVVLTQPSRTGNTISEVPNNLEDPFASTSLIFTDRTDKVVYDYMDFVEDYAELIDNAYGAYPVNAELKKFLEYFGNTPYSGVQNPQTDIAWLIPCGYFGVAPAQTLHVGSNTITLTDDEAKDFNGKAIIFTAAVAGTYTISTTDADATAWIVFDPILGVSGEDYFPSYTFTLDAGESITFYFSSASAAATTYTVTIALGGEENDETLVTGENSITFDDTYTNYFVYYTPAESGYYVFKVPFVNVWPDDEDPWAQGIASIYYEDDLFSFVDDTPDNDYYYVSAPIYLEAGVEAEFSISSGSVLGTYTFVFEETDATATPSDFNVGDNTVTGSSSGTFTTTFAGDTGTYNITGVIPKLMVGGQLTITIGNETETFTATPNIDMTVEITSGDTITVTYVGEQFSTFTLTITAAPATVD